MEAALFFFCYFIFNKCQCLINLIFKNLLFIINHQICNIFIIFYKKKKFLLNITSKVYLKCQKNRIKWRLATGKVFISCFYIVPEFENSPEKALGTFYSKTKRKTHRRLLKLLWGLSLRLLTIYLLSKKNLANLSRLFTLSHSK